MTHTNYDQKELLKWVYTTVESGSLVLAKQILTLVILWGTDEAEKLWLNKIFICKPLYITPK
jgi:hypothetical protein